MDVGERGGGLHVLPAAPRLVHAQLEVGADVCGQGAPRGDRAREFRALRRRGGVRAHSPPAWAPTAAYRELALHVHRSVPDPPAGARHHCGLHPEPRAQGHGGLALLPLRGRRHRHPRVGVGLRRCLSLRVRVRVLYVLLLLLLFVGRLKHKLLLLLLARKLLLRAVAPAVGALMHRPVAAVARRVPAHGGKEAAHGRLRVHPGVVHALRAVHGRGRGRR